MSSERKNKDTGAVGGIRQKRPKRVSLSMAFLGLFIAAAVYVVFPYVMLNYVISEGLIEKAVEGLTIDWTNIKPLFERWMYAGVILVILAFPTWLFPEGSKGRLAFSAVFMVASIVWLLYVLNFGNLEDLASVTYNGSTYKFGLVLQGFLYFMVFFKLLKILTIYGTYKDNSSKYLERSDAAHRE